MADARARWHVSGPVAARLPDGRLHLSHGPIDLILYAYGPGAAAEDAFGLAAESFVDVLPRLVSELPLLRRPVGEAPLGPVARRMHRACAPFARDRFVTPMAAVAGAVADHVLGAMVDGAPLTKAYVNNGGDIAVHLRGDSGFTVGLVDPGLAPEAAEGWGVVRLRAKDTSRGIATSGRGGRSFSLGIADSVTVLARDAAAADVAATLIANAVNLDHPSVTRVPACSLDPDSDLADRLVTVSMGALPESACNQALAAGVAAAEDALARGHIAAAALTLRGHTRAVGATAPLTLKEEIPA